MSKYKHLLESEQMVILFNAMTDLGYDRNMVFSAPILGDRPLFKVGIDNDGIAVSRIIDEKTYARMYRKASSNFGAALKREVPDYRDFQSTLVQSGILSLDGLTRLKQITASLPHQDIVHGGDVYYIALDTNLLRDRFFSNYLAKLPAGEYLDFVLCETVRDELKNRCGKISNKMVQGLGKEVKSFYATSLLNQNMLQDRLRYIGFVEYNRMRSITGCEEIAAPTAKSGMRNDQFIIQAYSDFAGIGRKVIFLSRDNEMVRMMRGEDNVIPIVLRQPKILNNEFTAQWKPFLNWLHLLGVIFGRLVMWMGKEPVADLEGVWTTKNAMDWENDRMRLVLQRPTAGDETERQEYQQMASRIRNELAVLEDLQSL